MVETDRAYLAGILDGEGYLELSPAPDRRISVSVSQAVRHQVITDWLQAHCGGKVRLTKALFLEWQVWSDAAAQVLEQALPYLQLKRAQAQILLAGAELKAKRKQWNYVPRFTPAECVVWAKLVERLKAERRP